MFGIKTLLQKKAAKVSSAVQAARIRREQRSKALVPSDREIFATLGDWTFNEDTPRHLYSVYDLLAEGGYNIYLYRKIDADFFDWLGPFGRLMFSHPSMKFVEKIPNKTEDMIYMFDHETPDEDLLKRPWKRLVYLSVQKPSSWQVGRGSLSVPFIMYPEIRRSKSRGNLETLRGRTRRIRAFFAGNMEKTLYRNRLLKRYGQMTRRQGMVALLRSRRKKIVYLPDEKEFYGLVRGESFRPACVIVDFSKFKIHPEHWLEVVASSDFFVCLSGTDYPMCHNLIESLAVGTIPILSYPELLDPPLEHGKNALIYRDKTELIERFDEALNMDRARLEEMRRNAARYYDEHLSSRSFVRRFEAFEGPHTLALHRWIINNDPDEEVRRKLGQLNARIAEYSRSAAHAR